MNNEAYSAYPSEGELLLMEGCPVWILAVESDIKIENTSKNFEKYNGKVITVIHMYHTKWL